MPQVLVVEDDVSLRTAVVHQLHRLGVKADSAANGIEAVRRVHAWQYDLILMDLEMPEMDGLEALGAIRAHEAKNGLPAVPIIAVSGSTRKERAMKAGFDAFYEKPAMQDEFIEILDRWLPPEKRRA